MAAARHPALGRWGDSRPGLPVPPLRLRSAWAGRYPVRLADGHRAYLVVGYEAARTALSHPDLSKDMHAALALDERSSPRGCPVRRSPGTCSASTRRTTPG